jgi:hypothetical protein
MKKTLFIFHNGTVFCYHFSRYSKYSKLLLKLVFFYTISL